MVATTQSVSLGFSFGSSAEFHLLQIGENRWFSLDRTGQHRLPYRKLTAKVLFFDVNDQQYDRASLSLSDGRSFITLVSSYLTNEVHRAMAIIGVKAGDVIEVDLDAIGTPMVQKVA